MYNGAKLEVIHTTGLIDFANGDILFQPEHQIRSMKKKYFTLKKYNKKECGRKSKKANEYRFMNNTVFGYTTGIATQYI